MQVWLKVSKLSGRYVCGAAIAVMSLVFSVNTRANTLFTAAPQVSSESVSSPDNQYGYAVAISADGTRAVIGVPFASISVGSTTYLNAGKVYVLGYNNSGANGGSWSLIKELDDPNPESNDFFGQAVALSLDGQTALIGAPGATLKGTSGTAANAGKAYFYNDSGGSWTEIQELDDNPTGGGGPLPNDEFGDAVALGGNGSALVALIGAPGTTVVCNNAPNCSSTAGAVYLYDVTNGTAVAASPTEFQDPDALATTTNGADNGYRFGAAVALSANGSAALFGAPYATVSTATAAGKVYLSALVNGTWGNPAEADDPGVTANDHFGTDLALSGTGTLILAGVPDAASEAGIAYLYAWNGATLGSPTSITEPNGQLAGNRFGAALGFSGNSSLAIIGSPGSAVADTTGTYTSTDAGKAYVYSVGSWSTPAYTLADPDALSATTNGIADNFNFGAAVALSAVNGTALIGAPKTTVNSDVVAGTADFYFNPVDLSLQMIANPSPAPLNGQFSYLFTVTNQGTLAVNGVSQAQTTNATNVVLTDTLPAAVTFSSANANSPNGATGNCSNSSGTVTCTLSSSLAPGGVWQPSITVTTGATPSVVKNQNASVNADQLETDNSDNSAGVSVTVDNAPIAVSNAPASAIPVHVSYSGTLPVTPAYSNQSLTYSLASNPAHGGIVLNPASGTYTYNANAGYGNVSGGQPDSFTFSAYDGYLNSNTARVNLQVYAAPTAANATLTVHVSASGKLSATDPDPSQTPVFGLVVTPAHGSVTLNATTGNYTYASAPGYTGSDRFAFHVKDSYNASNTASVNLTVYAAPQASAASYSVTENQLIHAALAVTEPDPTQTLTYSIVQPPAHGSVLLNASTGAFTYAPVQNYSGSDSFTFNAHDSFNTSNTATVTVDVAPAPPPATPPSSSSSGGGGTDPISLLWLGLICLCLMYSHRHQVLGRRGRCVVGGRGIR